MISSLGEVSGELHAEMPADQMVSDLRSSSWLMIDINFDNPGHGRIWLPADSFE